MKGLNLSRDRKIHWIKCWSTEWERSESQSWQKISLLQTLTQEMHKDRISAWQNYLLIQTVIQWMQKEWISVKIQSESVKIQIQIHWSWKDRIWVMKERFSDSSNDSLNAKGETLGIHTYQLNLRHDPNDSLHWPKWHRIFSEAPLINHHHEIICSSNLLMNRSILGPLHQ